MADDYTPPTTEAEWKTLATTELTHLTNEEQERLPGDWDVWIARVKRDAAREAVPALLDALKQAEARVRHLEDTARVLVKDMLAATDARDEHRRGKAAAEERIAEEKHLRMKATEAATKAEARIEAVQDLIDQADTAGDWTVTCTHLQWAIDGTTPTPTHYPEEEARHATDE